MPEIALQQSPAALTNLTLSEESFGTEIGAPSKQTENNFYEHEGMYAGTWECEPGVMELDLEITEFCHLLSGHWVLTSESGQVTEITAGDSWIFPKGWKGKSEVIETVRKVYMIIS
ncbi:MAG: cupin domain-containing protein [Pseudomonadota bacterium]